MEGDEKHGRLIREELGILPGSIGVVSRVLRAEVDEDGGDEKVSREEATKYREMSARASYPSVDRPDIRYVVKKACSGMPSPSEADLRKIKRVARCMRACRRLSSRVGTIWFLSARSR